MRRPLNPSREDAERTAVEALAYLSADEERLWAFLGATGLDPGSIREAARSRGFLVAVLDHVAENERLLIDLAASLGMRPEDVMAARGALSPEPRGEAP